MKLPMRSTNLREPSFSRPVAAACALALAVTIFAAAAAASEIAGVASIAGAASPATVQENALTPEEARDHVGEEATVCGKVVSANYLPRTRRRPTYLNLDEAYPLQVFSIVIWGRHRSRFPDAPDTIYADKDVCVTGTIVLADDVAQIAVEGPDEITIVEQDGGDAAPIGP